MPIRPVIALLALAGALLAPASASAAWFPAETIDGGAADVVALGDVDLARDGTGAVVFLRREGGVPHVFLSRMIDGVWRPAERVDVGLDGEATAATVAAGDGRRLAVGFVSGGRLYGSFAPGGGALAPLSPPQILNDGPVSSVHSDLGINGTGYLVFATAGDVRAARLQDTTWEAVPAPLDVDPGQIAGDGTGRPRIAVSAEGNAVATWGENAADGRRRVYGRRITELRVSASPQDISLGDFAGAPGGPADSPDIDIEDDGSYAWVVWRQDFGGASRTLARRLRGSLFEAPTAIDGGGPASAPRFEMNGRGIGFSVTAGPGNSVLGGVVDVTDSFTSFPRVDGGGAEAPPAPAVAVSERRQVGVAWRREAGGTATVQARFAPDEKPFEPEVTLSVPGFGTVSGEPEISTSKSGDYAVAFVQQAGDTRRLVAAVFDDPPPTPVGRTTSTFQRRRQPILKWSPSTDLWGPARYRVFVDDVEVAQSGTNQATVPAPLTDGDHSWRVESIDRRGQAAASTPRPLKIDTTPPRVRVKVTGRRKRGSTVKIAVQPTDPGSGIGTVTVDYGDRSRTVKARRSSHRYRRSGTFSLKVRVSDRARNVTRKTVRLRIGR